MHSPLRRLSGRSTSVRAAALALGTLVLAGCAEDKPLNTFEPEGPSAELIYNLMSPIWIIMGVIFLLVIGGTILISIRGRVNGDELDAEDLPEQVHGNTPLELGWTIAPAVLLAAIAFPVVGAIWDLEELDENNLQVMVIGQQWWWEYRYDVDGDGFFVDANGDGVVDAKDEELPLDISLDRDDVVTATELVIPAGEQVDLTLTSRDVIHSFWIPRLNGKRDTVPGRWHTWSLEANEPGKFTGWCTEFCGLSHARMRMSAIALSRPDFDAWLANQMLPAEIPTDPEALAGREIFLNQCQRCHVIDDGDIEYGDEYFTNIGLVSKAAPNLTHFATRTSFAGGIYGVYAGGPGSSTDPNDDAFPAEDYLRIAELSDDPTTTDDYRFNSAELKRWIANAPDRKDMASEPNPETGLARGMPAFDFSDEQLDQLIAYLETLD